jgi:hypothetical protein
MLWFGSLLKEVEACGPFELITSASLFARGLASAGLVDSPHPSECAIRMNKPRMGRVGPRPKKKGIPGLLS